MCGLRDIERSVAAIPLFAEHGGVFFQIAAYDRVDDDAPAIAVTLDQGAVGLSRQLYGLTMTTERPGHSMMEQWLPLGPVAVISAFNFPVAVWCWNAALARVCGDPVLWKPSEKTTLTARAVQAVFQRAARQFAAQTVRDVAGLSQLLFGGPDVGKALVEDRRVALFFATGSTAMCLAVSPILAQRFALSLIHL